MIAYRQPSSSLLAAPAPAHHHQHATKTTFDHPSAPSSSSSSSTRPSSSSSGNRVSHHRQQHMQPPLPTAAAALPTASKAVTKRDKGKLTEQWGSPPVVIQRSPGSTLTRGNLLGEGGFARVYLATEQDGSEKAVKVIAKEQLTSTKNKSKLFGEIKIHQAMLHPNIISFEHCFEDDGNVYMQLELCANGSLLDLLRVRKRYTEPEARYYLVQLIGACEYMHSNSVIHRDLKLGNLMLDADMRLRVGDFGLAALVKFPGERKKTICGTPNYIAPEILFDQSNGHSFEVDIWSIGVILYTLLVGKPPFQMKEVKHIYRKIKELNYDFPAHVRVSVEATDLIEQILTAAPDKRPTLADILSHSFFTCGPFPERIPSDSMTTIPYFGNVSIRASHRNFVAVKKECGISDVGAAVASSSTATVPVARTRTMPAVAEDVEEVQVAAEKKGANEVRGMEKEVREVLMPNSPISELLRSARKPLMVSPNAEPRELLQRKLLAEARSAASATSLSSSANPPPPATTTTTTSGARHSRLEPKPAAIEKENDRPVAASMRERPTKVSVSAREVERSSTTTTASRRTATGMPIVNPLSPSRESNANPVTKVATTFSVQAALPVKKERTTGAITSSRALFEATYLSLDNALTITTTTGLEALPNPLPLEAPKVFVTAWVDYSYKYGTAYALTDGSAGMLFNDSSSMVLAPGKINFDYIQIREANVYSRRSIPLKEHPEALERKVYLLEYFADYMQKTLNRDVAWTFTDTMRTRDMEFLVRLYMQEDAIVFRLTNEVLQFNFNDHTKVLLSQHGSVITFIDAEHHQHVYSLLSLFREASRLGFYRLPSHTNQESTMDPTRWKKLEKIRFLISKLKYCRDTLEAMRAGR